MQTLAAAPTVLPWIGQTSAEPERIAAAAAGIRSQLAFRDFANVDLEPGDMTYYGIVVTRLDREPGLRAGATHVISVANLGFVANVHLGDPVTGPRHVHPDYLDHHDRGRTARGSLVVIAAVLTELSALLHP